MIDVQNLIFRWAQNQSQTASLVLFALGVLFGLQGFRFSRALLAFVCAAGGFVVGGVAASAAKLPEDLCTFSLAGLLGVVGLWKSRVGAAIAAMFTFLALAHYLATRFQLAPTSVMIAWLVGAGLGLSLFYLYMRQTPILVTTVIGAGLMIVGFLGMASRFAPSLADTFVTTADHYTVMAPVLGFMLCVLGYSVQANAHQGDIKSGGASSLNHLEVG